jgi:hypothetical protein
LLADSLVYIQTIDKQNRTRTILYLYINII